MTTPFERAEEAIIVRRARDGDGRAFDELVSRHQDDVYRLCHEILRQEEAAAEALRDTFLSAYRGLAELAEGSSFSTWLYRIATNTSLMKYHRLRDRHVSFDPSQGPDEAAEPAPAPDWLALPPEELLTAETRKVMAEGMQHLHEDLRTVFVLRDIEALSNAEVSAILKLSVPAVKARLHRGRLFLRDWMTRYFDEQPARRSSSRERTLAPAKASTRMPASGVSARTGAGRSSPVGADRRPDRAARGERLSGSHA